MTQKNLFGEVEEYTFQSFGKTKINPGKVTDFVFPDIEGMSVRDIERQQDVIKLEREFIAKTEFKIAPIVEEHRGIKKQVQEEKEKKIEAEVIKRLALIEESAYKKGFESGLSSGREEVFSQTRIASEEKLQSLSNMIIDVLNSKEEMIKVQKTQIYTLVRNLTKWITLSELRNDGKYITRLLDKLITEIQTKSNLLIHVDQKSFETMPEVLEVVQAKLGELTNVRVEVDYDIEGPGIVVESSNGIVNGTLEEQFKSLDKLFEHVGIFNDESINPVIMGTSVSENSSTENETSKETTDNTFVEVDDSGSDDSED